MANLQLDGKTVATISDEMAREISQVVELHGIGEQQLEGHQIHLVSDGVARPRWIAAEMSIGLVFWKDHPARSEV